MLFNHEYNIQLPTPREWQEKNFPAVINKLQANINTLLCVPTGTGKTVLAAMAIADYIKRQKRVLFIVDRLVLIQQTKSVFESCGMPCDILQGQNSTYTNAPIIIASQQTLVRRDMPVVDLVIIDETHIISLALKEILKTLTIPVLGLSATPFAKGLSKIYKNLFNPYTTNQATLDGVLVPLRVKECKMIDMSGSKKIGGEFSDRDVETAANRIIGDIVKEYRIHANNKAICFAATIKQCESLAAEFISQGINAAVFCATTNAHERKIMIEKFSQNDREIMVLISVAALSTGFDARNVETILDCRPLSKSLSVYIQSIGRGLRSNPGKKECLLLDFTGNMGHFMEDFVNFYMHGIGYLDSGEKLEKARPEKYRKKKESKGCPKCHSKLWVIVDSNVSCLACGHIVPKQEEEFQAQRNNYEVKELDIFSAVKNQTNSSLWTELSNYTYAKVLAGKIDNEKALKMAKAIYKNITNEFPKWGEILKPTVELKVSKKVLNKIALLKLEYNKSLKSVPLRQAEFNTVNHIQSSLLEGDTPPWI